MKKVVVSSCHPYQNPRASVAARTADLLKRMTLEEKVAQLQCSENVKDLPHCIGRNGIGSLASVLRQLPAGEAADMANQIQAHVKAHTRLGIPILIHEEALHGLFTKKASSFPQSIGLAASWNTDLMSQVASAIAREAKSRGIRHVLSPTINIARDVRWGRTHETYGEDPILTSRMAVAFCKAFEDCRIATTVKHFVANIGDGGRDSWPIHHSARLLEEVYLPAFKAAIEQAGASSVMAGYNSYEGVPCSSSSALLTDVLRKKWKFKGIVVSDYHSLSGSHWEHRMRELPEETTAATLRAGMDIELPSSGMYSVKNIRAALARKLMTIRDLDATVARVLALKFRLGLFDDAALDPADADRVNDCSAHRDLALRAARESIVLLTNPHSVLPLAAASVKKLAVFGPVAATVDLGMYSGFGMKQVSVLEGITAKLSANRVAYRQVFDPGEPLYDSVGPDMLFTDAQCTTPGLCGEYFDSHDFSTAPKRVQTDAAIDFSWKETTPFDEPITQPFAIRWAGVLRAPKSGDYVVRTTGLSTVRLWLNGRMIVDTSIRSPGQRCFAQVNLCAGTVYALKIEFSSYFDNAGWPKDRALKLEWSVPRDYTAQIREAVDIAQDATAAIVVAGRVEGEDKDRANLDLPYPQEDLITALCATKTPVIVLLHTGSAVTMQRWIDKVAAVVQIWYPGEEGGGAVADVLFGDYNPAGRLPISFPQSVGQCPLYYNPKATGRSYDYINLSGRPLFPFGHGLSYTEFRYSNLRMTSKSISQQGAISISVDVANTGERDGEEVVQLYIRDCVASTSRPVRELRDFQRIAIAAGKSKTVTFSLGQDALRMLDESMHWVVEPGEFEVMMGASSADIRLSGRFRVR